MSTCLLPGKRSHASSRLPALQSQKLSSLSYYHPHFKSEETEAQNMFIICPRFHSVSDTAGRLTPPCPSLTQVPPTRTMCTPLSQCRSHHPPPIIGLLSSSNQPKPNLIALHHLSYTRFPRNPGLRHCLDPLVIYESR